MSGEGYKYKYKGIVGEKLTPKMTPNFDIFWQNLSKMVSLMTVGHEIVENQFLEAFQLEKKTSSVPFTLLPQVQEGRPPY